MVTVTITTSSKSGDVMSSPCTEIYTYEQQTVENSDSRRHELVSANIQ